MAESKYEFDDRKAAFAEAAKRIRQALKTVEKTLDLIGIRRRALCHSPRPLFDSLVTAKPVP